MPTPRCAIARSVRAWDFRRRVREALAAKEASFSAEHDGAGLRSRLFKAGEDDFARLWQRLDRHFSLAPRIEKSAFYRRYNPCRSIFQTRDGHRRLQLPQASSAVKASTPAELKFPDKKRLHLDKVENCGFRAEDGGQARGSGNSSARSGRARVAPAGRLIYRHRRRESTP
jgi:hypothetical protein